MANFTKVVPWTNPDTGQVIRNFPQQNPMNAYFTQLADPRYRQAMQQQNLFSNLLNFGAQMSAAGAPSFDPGYAGRTRAGALAGLGKGLMSGNQAYRDQMMNAMKLKSMMDTSGLARQKIRQKNEARKKMMGLFGGSGTQAKAPQIQQPADAIDQTIVGEGDLPKTPSITSAPMNDVTLNKYGYVPSPGREAQLRMLASTGEAKDVSQAMGEFRKIDNSLVKDARDRLQKPFTSFREAIVNQDKAITALNRADGPGDLTAVTVIQRSIDNGIVRKEDMDNWSRTLGFVGGFKALLGRIEAGTILTPKQRTSLSRTANELFNSHKSSFSSFFNIQRSLARENNVPWHRVAGPELEKLIKLDPARKPNRPKVGNTPTEKKYNLQSPVVGGT